MSPAEEAELVAELEVLIGQLERLSDTITADIEASRADA